MARPKTRDDALKTHVIESAMALLENGGPQAITARVVAREAATSTAAIYELFGDKAGLVRSLYLEGFTQLAHALEQLEDAGTPREQVAASMEAVRSFALSHPLLSDLMYAKPFAEFTPAASDQQAAVAIHRHVCARVANWLELPKRSARVNDAAQALVALNRGLLAEEQAGLLGTSATSRRRRRKVAVDAMLDGLQQQANSTRS